MRRGPVENIVAGSAVAQWPVEADTPGRVLRLWPDFRGNIPPPFSGNYGFLVESE
jgi:hypothetical protein